MRFLDAYQSGDLEAAVRAVFDAHLADCPDCVTFLRQYETTVRLAKRAFGPADEPDVPEQLVDAILAARDGRTASQHRGRRPRRRSRSRP